MEKKKEERMHLPKVTIDDFFTTQEERDKKDLEYVSMIPVKEIANFPNHPYQIREDEEMLNMAESIKKFGIIHPVIVRKKENGGYEMISGHRRKRACEIAGVKEIKAIVRKLTDDEATILMVDSNNQREKVLPSEKAFAYKMKLEAMKRQGQRNDLTSATELQKLAGKTSREIIADEIGESHEQVRRYIRLTYLVPELLKIVDEGKMGLRIAIELSYLTEDEQKIVADNMEYLDVVPSHAQARIMRAKSEKGELTNEEIEILLEEEKPNQKEQIKFKYDKVKEYFPSGYSIEKMQEVITKLLESYQAEWKRKKQRDYVR